MSGFGFFDDEEQTSPQDESPAKPQPTRDIIRHDEGTLKLTEVVIERSTVRTVLLFIKNRQFFGVPVQYVKEVHGTLDLKPLPVSLPHIAGVVAVGGSIVATIDDESAFGGFTQPAETDQSSGTHIICEVDGHPFALRVDQASQVIEIPEEAVRPLPQKGKNPTSSVKDIARYENETLLFLDVHAIIEKIQKSRIGLGA